jgi:hypothetical protein
MISVRPASYVFLIAVKLTSLDFLLGGHLFAVWQHGLTCLISFN